MSGPSGLWTFSFSRGQWPCSILILLLCPYAGVLLLLLASRWQERPGKNNMNERINEVSLYLVGLPPRVRGKASRKSLMEAKVFHVDLPQAG